MSDGRDSVTTKLLSVYEVLLPEPDPLHERKVRWYARHQRTAILYGEGIYVALTNNMCRAQ